VGNDFANSGFQFATLTTSGTGLSGTGATQDFDMENNHWGFVDAADIEPYVYHKPDLASLGQIFYSPALPHVYSIIATAGVGGSISPSDTVNVFYGSDTSFTITPDAGYNIDSVYVNNIYVGTMSSYSFENVKAHHTIFVTFTPSFGPLDNFLVEATGGGAIGTQVAGTSFSLRITARDLSNITVANFSGTVDISSTGTLSSGNGTTVAFVAGVLSSHSVTLSNTGNFAITATKTGGSETGTSNSFTVNAGASSTITSQITASPTSITANGTSTSTITVQMKDVFGNNLTTGGETIAFSTTSGTFGAVTDNNNGTYTATLTSSTVAGAATITGVLNGNTLTDDATVTFTAGNLHNFLVEEAGGGAIGNQTAGSPFSIKITARDQFNNTVTSYIDTVNISSTGTLSAGGGTSAAFVSGVLSSHSVTISNTGNFTITAVGGSGSGVSNSFTVNAGVLNNFFVESSAGGNIGTQTAGAPFTIKITARDAGNNTVTSFTGTVDISSTGTLSSGAGTSATFTAGVLSSHSVTIVNSGAFTITATKTSSSESGTSNSFTVNASTLDHFLVQSSSGGTISSQTAGTAFNIKITAKDAYNNTVTTFATTVDVSSTGTLSTGSGTTSSFTSGVLNSHSITISNTGTFTITATKTGSTEFGTSNSFTVNGGSVSSFVVETVGGGNIGTQSAGVPFSIRVTAYDALNNVATGFTGTVSISSTGTISSGSGTTVSFTAGILASHSI
ncbi:MAG: hypothetical protein HYZ33_04145, partial [Ignavibacteriales bacterium]|nr:hypothetical protein [Ignavibacteriales bacterium]